MTSEFLLVLSCSLSSLGIDLLIFSRDDKRYTEKKNKSERARRKKEDNTRLRGLVDISSSLDPRIKRIRQEEKEARQAKKRGITSPGPGQKSQKQEEEEKKKAEEEARKREEEEKVCLIILSVFSSQNLLLDRLLKQTPKRQRLLLQMLLRKPGEQQGLLPTDLLEINCISIRHHVISGVTVQSSFKIIIRFTRVKSLVC